jgi:TonB family protein
MSTVNIQDQRFHAPAKRTVFASSRDSGAMQIGSLGLPFISSVVIHAVILLFGSFFIHRGGMQRPEFLSINLIELPRMETLTPETKVQAPPAVREPPPAPLPEVHKPKKETKPPAAKSQSAPPPLLKQEPQRAIETKPLAPVEPEPAPSSAATSAVEGGGSEAGAGKLFENGDIGVIPGKGTAGGGGGTATSGLGRGSGLPGLPAAPLRTHREAKPLQTVRATYPPMALRAGLESDVGLRIEIDTQGKVSKAEVTKSGGAGFDEEALKAVKQSRFEPAQQDGHNVPAEFTYVYRFRLQR